MMLTQKCLRIFFVQWHLHFGVQGEGFNQSCLQPAATKKKAGSKSCSEDENAPGTVKKVVADF